MSKVKKILAVILSLAMIMGMSVTSFAAGVKPVATDTQTATANNIEATATVTAYQIVKADYNEAGFTGYSAVDGVTIANPLAPTSTEITTIANSNLSGLKSTPMTTTATSGLAAFTADLNAGYWMVLVNGTVNEVYNPMLVGVAYSTSGSDNTMTADPVDANSDWTLVTDGAYAKSSAPTIDKEIVGGDKDVAIGDTVNFKISTEIPSYSADYSEVIVKISDALSTGLTLDTASIVVSIPEGNYTLTSTTAGFELTVNSAYALAHGKEAVTVTYSATLNDQAGINFDANTNTANLEYSNDPSNSEITKTTDDKTYTYTFGIDAALNGSSTEEWNKITQELVKGEMVEETTESGKKEVFKALAGATFTLTNDDTNKVYTAVSGTDGALQFTGLDAGNYTLVETAAPEGYTVNTQKIPVVITAEYNGNGTLKSYSIAIDNKITSTYTATYTGETTTSPTITNIVEGEENAVTQIKNTKISSLPSTGGIGTTIFTIGGCIIMIAAAFLFFRSRKKSEQ